VRRYRAGGGGFRRFSPNLKNSLLRHPVAARVFVTASLLASLDGRGDGLPSCCGQGRAGLVRGAVFSTTKCPGEQVPEGCALVVVECVQGVVLDGIERPGGPL